jgi:hypothetical protein
MSEKLIPSIPTSIYLKGRQSVSSLTPDSSESRTNVRRSSSSNKRIVFNNRDNPFSTQNTKKTGERFKYEMQQRAILRKQKEEKLKEIEKKLKTIKNDLKKRSRRGGKKKTKKHTKRYRNISI